MGTPLKLFLAAGGLIIIGAVLFGVAISRDGVSLMLPTAFVVVGIILGLIAVISALLDNQ